MYIGCHVGFWFQSETGKLSASDVFYRDYVRKLQQTEPCCPLCKRQFEEENDAIQLAHEVIILLNLWNVFILKENIYFHWS